MHLLTLPAGALPPPLDFYPEMAGAALLEVLSARARLVPFNLAATLVFLLAVGHTFVTRLFMSLAHEIQERSDARAHATGREPAPSVAAELVHFVGEVEVVFGLWAVVLVAVIVAFYDWPTAVAYLDGGVAFTEALFVVVIMALASSQPILALAERTLARVAALGGGTPAAWWLTILTLAPLLGSLITEPAAMTIGALLLARQFYDLRPSPWLAYATLGALFVNISVGGTLTHFAAPPVIMVARPWSWDTPFMLSHFGGKAVLGILAVNALTFLVFRRELRRLADRATQAQEASTALAPVPGFVTAFNLGFMAWTVANAHHPPLFLAGFLFFLGFARATAAHQGSLDLKPPLLVGFFLASLVVHGGLQGWWIAPILAKLDAGPLFLGAALLTAFNDNALVTYLATLVPGLSDAGRYAIVAGAVTGGGLTVIANAPNPAGQSILSRSFEGGIAPLGLLAGATLPTLVFAAIFMLWR
jgi:Putative Na+/H+ antiporter